MTTNEGDMSKETHHELAAGGLGCAKAENKLALVGCSAVTALPMLGMFLLLL